jgi:hypothetical protein
MLWVCVTLGVTALLFTVIEERRVGLILFGLIWVEVTFRWVGSVAFGLFKLGSVSVLWVVLR